MTIDADAFSRVVGPLLDAASVGRGKRLLDVGVPTVSVELGPGRRR
jgi:hypothetical protein